MKLRQGQWIAILIVIASIVIAGWAYTQLPEKVASHWNTAGEVDGYMSRFWGAFLLPIVYIFMLCLFFILPKIDPKRQNIEKFLTHFDRFIVMLFSVLLYFYALTLKWNLQGEYDFLIWFLPGLGVLFWSVGTLVKNAEPNWTIGIRTPWTLSSDSVWRQTHILGARLFRLLAIVTVASIVLPPLAALWSVLGSAIALTIILIGYSYYLYRRGNGA